MRNCLMCIKYSALGEKKKEFDRRSAFGIEVTKGDKYRARWGQHEALCCS